MLHTYLRRPWSRCWSRVLRLLSVAVLVLGLAACGTSVQGSGRLGANASPTTTGEASVAASPTVTASPTQPAPSVSATVQGSPTAETSPTVAASPPAGAIPGAVPVGAQGSTAWVLTAGQFLRSTDEGAHWSSTPLPTGLSDAVTTAAVGPDGALWLLSAYGSTASFYQAASPTSAWIKTSVSLSWPPGMAGADGAVPPDDRIVTFGSSAPGIVTAVVTEGSTGSIGLVLLSTDGGKTFQQHDPPTLYGDWHPAFTSATTGVLVGNGVFGDGTPAPEPGAIYSTTDGGASWQPVTLPGFAQPSVSSSAWPSLLGTPLVVGSSIYVTANVPVTAGRRLLLYISEDGGQTFTLQGSIVDPDMNDNSAPLLGVSGSDVWMATQPPTGSSTIYESSDGGVSWTAVPAPALTSGAVLSIGLNSQTEAIAWLEQNACKAFKTDCSSFEVLRATTDGGQQWQSVAVPAQSS